MLYDIFFQVVPVDDSPGEEGIFVGWSLGGLNYVALGIFPGVVSNNVCGLEV